MADGRDGSERNPAAVASALDAAKASADAAARAAIFLDKQSALTDLQIEDLKREDKLRHWSLIVHHISDVMKLAFEFAVAAILLTIVALLAGAVWSAARDHGVVIEAFNVPPDMAARGLTGEVVATKLLDRLSTMQAQTVSRRAASSYANNWGNDIKVQIPDTGVSIGQLNTYLHTALGHETQISGEIYRTATGIAVTARAGSNASPTFTGSDADLDKLIQQAAESVYRVTQPYRYAVYLSTHNRVADALKLAQDLSAHGSPDDRAWAYILLSNQTNNTGDIAGSLVLLRKAIAIKSDILLAHENLASAEGALQHDEQKLEADRDTAALAARGGGADIDPAQVPAVGMLATQEIASLLGDNLAVLDEGRQIVAVPDYNSWNSALSDDLVACGALHDPACMRRTWAQFPPSKNPIVALSQQANLQVADIAIGQWRAAAESAPALFAGLSRMGKLGIYFAACCEDRIAALADAELGDFKTADLLIAKTPLDCALCLDNRGLIDGLEKNWRGADTWFARAVAAAPSIPRNDSDWGAMLLAKGDLDGAIAKFELANQKGPHFADPLEMWGEALMAKNRSDLALAKFDEAEKYAPNWGRLHLKWGEALYWSGDKTGAAKQFAIAATLDLSASQRQELGMMQGAAAINGKTRT
ncbi:MAG TPA: hypothetical protein VGG36_11780 [Rhizomicrobium sp.]|jgi:tetratricopeptide (TPR) repeat protein